MNSHKKEVFHKEEYEVLEMTPFTDYAEFSRHCPTVLQRTFYRWKRRIKDEYIFLEQHPEMGYQEYLQYIPHAKENVFAFWKTLMKKGYLFGTGSASHLTAMLPQKNEDGRKSSPAPGQQWDEENGQPVLKFMQTNMTAEYHDVVKHFPTLPEQLFKMWKQKNLQAYTFLEQNFSLDFSVFARYFPTVSEDVFNLWRQNAVVDSRNKILNLQREAVSTAEHIQEAQKALWSSLISQRLAQEQNRYSGWSGLAGGWLGEYPSFWGTAMNLSTLSHLNQNQLLQAQQEHPHLEAIKAAGSSSSVNSDTSVKSDLSFGQNQKGKSDDDSDHAVSIKSKKQHKAEFLYYLQNPDMDFSRVGVVFPTISQRTFLRWKKQIKSAITSIQEVPDCTFETFHSSYPDIPKEIFLQWKDKEKMYRKDNAKVYQNDHQIDDDKVCYKTSEVYPRDDQDKISDNVGDRQGSVGDRLSDSEHDLEVDDELRDENLNMKGDDRGKKMNMHEFFYLQLNPSIDFAGFTYRFPHISMRTFYRWRREIQDQINVIRRSPNISLSDMQKVYPEMSDEVLSVWKKVVKSERNLMNGYVVGENESDSVNLSQNKENMLHDPNNVEQALHLGHTKKLKLSSNVEVSSGHSPKNCDKSKLWSPRTTGRMLMKTGRPEYLYLIQNPDIDLHSFLGMFPDMSPATFYRWRREMKAILDYMASHPDAGYQVVVAEFPEVTQDMFSQWREKLKKNPRRVEEKIQKKAEDKEDENPIKSLQALVNDGDTYTSKQNYHGEPGFSFLLENPGTSIVEFGKIFPTVPAGTFSRWKKLVKDWFSLLKVSVDIDYQTFSYYCSEVPEVIFNKWKLMMSKKDEGPEDLSDAEGMGGQNINSPEDWVLTKTRKVNQTEYLFFLMNPYMDYNEFAVTFPMISLRTFYRWRREIRESLEYLEQHPDVSFKAFFQVFPVVPEEVFLKWKDLCSEQNRKVEVSSESLKRSLNCSVKEPENLSCKPDDTTGDAEVKSASVDLSCKKIPAEEDRAVDSPGTPGISNSLSTSESLSAAVESICRSAGLPPLDQAVDDSINQHSASIATSVSSLLGGVAFPGMATPRPTLEASAAKTLQSKHEELSDDSKPECNNSTPPPTVPSVGGIPLIGMPAVPGFIDSSAVLASQMIKEESFFSPRARKQSREEYLFLQQNPNMDFQEFCSHYPTISLRTFYRWKREFRQSQEFVMGLHPTAMQ